MKIKTSIVLLALAALTSCEKKGDTEPPTIELVSPANGDTLWVGSGIHLDAEFSDNVELGSYKISIHSNFNDHSHKSAQQDNDHVAWNYQTTWDFEPGSRNAHIHHHEVQVPNELDGHGVATGKYHFMVYCVDKAGNESWVARSVVIAHGEANGHSR